jgi:hypothetical protein
MLYPPLQAFAQAEGRAYVREGRDVIPESFVAGLVATA